MISDRWRIGAELERYIHPLNEQHPGVYNVCSCQAAPETVNVQDALVIGSEQSKRFSASLSSDFHATTKKKVKSMEAINVNVKGKVANDCHNMCGFVRSICLENIQLIIY